MLHNCRVVLVRPAIAPNIGATARVMRNFGLDDLRLISPQADPLDPEARKLSTHGESILHNAKSVAEFGEAVGDCLLVIGTSARTGGMFRRQSVVSPWEIMPKVVETLGRGPVALAFGTEKSGLTDAEVTRCHYLMSIPTDETYAALNLAQAVGICLYELRKVWLSRETRISETAAPAPFEAQERMFAQLDGALRDLHFLWGDSAESLMHAVRHMIGRAQPTPTEVDMLLGLARQIRWFVEKNKSQ